MSTSREWIISHFVEKQTKNGRLSTLVLRDLETVALQEVEG